jgi:hypothetical protein
MINRIVRNGSQPTRDFFPFCVSRVPAVTVNDCCSIHGDDGAVRANQFHRTCRGSGDGMQTEWIRCNTGSPSGDRSRDQLATRESQAGPYGVAERSVVRGSWVTPAEGRDLS